MVPKFSIVVPIYNVEKYLPRCIDSLVNQTLQDIEIILVDDGSPDGSPAICDAYAEKDPRIKVIHKLNGGVSAARNDGLRISKGEWVIFCDSDDWMELDACESMYMCGNEKNVDVVIADINRIKGETVEYNQFFAHDFVLTTREDMDNLVETGIYQTYCRFLPENARAGFYGGPWNKAVRRKLLLECDIQFDVSLFGLYDDTLYTVNVYANAHSIAYIQKAVYNYVVVATSLTKSYKANSIEISNHVFSAFSGFMAKYSYDVIFARAYDALVVKRLDDMLKVYFFSEMNPKPVTSRYRELKALIHTEPYYSRSQTVEIGKLMPHHKRLAILLRTHSTIGIWYYYQLKIFMRRI